MLSSVKEKSEAFVKANPDAKASANPFYNFFPMWRASMLPDATAKVRRFRLSFSPYSTIFPIVLSFPYI